MHVNKAALLVLILLCASASYAQRLPVVNGDNNNWGTILNDYLNVTLNESGQLRNNTVNTAQITDGSITGSDISNTTNLSIGQTITFALGQVIDAISAGWTRITGNLNVTGNTTIGQGITTQRINITNAGVVITLNETDNILIDGSTNPRQRTIGAIRQLHKPAITGTRAINFVVDANGRSDTHAIVVDFTAKNIATGEQGTPFLVTIDTSDSTGGTIDALKVDKIGTGAVSVGALHVAPGVYPVEQHSGTFGNVNTALTELAAGGFSDVTSQFNSLGSDVQLFINDNDLIYVGSDDPFAQLSVLLATPASNSIQPEFEYSLAAGWNTFGPSDGSSGFRTNGVISWNTASLASWAKQTVNGANKYWIRVRRTRNSLATPPTEDLIQASASVLYRWDENGALQIARINATTSATNHFIGNTAFGTVNPTRNVHINDTLKIEPRSAAPTSATLGDIYVDSDTKELCFYNGTAWLGLGTGGACA